MKNIRHMTLEQYKEQIVPKIVEMKKIIRKKYLKSAEFYGILHLPKEEYVSYQVEKARGREYFDEKFQIEFANEGWHKMGLKTDPIPAELLEGFNKIFNEISPLFINHTKADISKLHKDHKAEIRRAIDTDVYVKELKSGELTFDELEPICDSVGVRIPKRVLELKEKVEAGLYSRESVKVNSEFLKSIRNFLAPMVKELEQMKRDQLMAWVNEFEGQDKSFYDYWDKTKKRRDVSGELAMLFRGKQRSDDFDKRLKNLCEHYADSYVSTFIGRLENKLGHVNLNWGIPKIEFISDRRFTGGQLNVDFQLTYDNGEVISGNSNVIIAGGYIQCLHQRYLFNFWHNGNNVSLEQMDQLK